MIQPGTSFGISVLRALRLLRIFKVTKWVSHVSSPVSVFLSHYLALWTVLRRTKHFKCPLFPFSGIGRLWGTWWCLCWTPWNPLSVYSSSFSSSFWSLLCWACSFLEDSQYNTTIHIITEKKMHLFIYFHGSPESVQALNNAWHGNTLCKNNITTNFFSSGLILKPAHHLQTLILFLQQ